MSENKRRSLPPRRIPRGMDRNDSLEELSKVNDFSVKNETEVKREFEEGWNQGAGDVIVKKEEDNESYLDDPPITQSRGTLGVRTKLMSNQSQTNQNELTEGNIPKNKKGRRIRRQQLERAAKFGLTEKDLPESVQGRANLLSKLRRRKVRASETPEEKAERNRRELERQRIRRANEDPVKRKKRLMAQNEYSKKLRAMKTPEEVEARRRRHCETERESYKRLKHSEQNLKIARETPEEREERQRKLKEQRLERNGRERFKRLERKLGMTEEEKAEEKARNFLKKQALEAKMTQEELEAYKERKKEWNKEYFKNLSGEKLARHRANVYKAFKKYLSNNKEKLKERHKRKLAEDPFYRAKVRLNYRIIQAKQKLKRDLVRDGASEEVVKEELAKLSERMKAEPLPPPETVSEYKARSKKKSPVQKPEPITNPFHGQSLGEDEYLQEEDFAPPSPEAASPAPVLSPRSIDEAEEERREVPISSSKPAIQSPILSVSHTVLVLASPPSSEINKMTATEDSSTPTKESKLQPTSPAHYIDKATPLNLNWKCPLCRTVLPSKENFSVHYNTIHKIVQKNQMEPEQDSLEHIRKLDHKGNDKPKPSPILPILCMKCPLQQQLTSGNSSFKGKDNLLAHVRQKHRKFYFPCPNCNLLKYRKSALEQHLSICQS